VKTPALAHEVVDRRASRAVNDVLEDSPASAPAMAGDRGLILVADDTEANRYAVGRSLRAAGYEVLEADSGQAALDAMAAKPDLVILDVKLPDLSGFEVCRRIKSDPATRSVPVLHLSAVLVATCHKVEGLESGADAYLVHPAEPVELIATVRALLRIREGEEALRALNESLERRVAERTAELLAHQRRLRELLGELGRAEQRERQRLAVELHDNLVQTLVVCKMRVSAIHAAAAPRTETAAEAALVIDILDDGITYARSLMAELAPVLLNDNDLAAAVDSVGKRMAKHGLRVRVVDDKKPKPLHRDVLGLLFQSVGELLFNVVKHAGSADATVKLERSGREVRMTVSDTGAGFDPSASPAAPSEQGGFGLMSIRERLGLLGGRLEIESAPGRGTRVVVTVPADARED
jgi:signal transduction histidine kinase